MVLPVLIGLMGGCDVVEQLAMITTNDITIKRLQILPTDLPERPAQDLFVEFMPISYCWFPSCSFWRLESRFNVD